MNSKTGKENASNHNSYETSNEGIGAPGTVREFNKGVKVRQIVWVKENASLVIENSIEGSCRIIFTNDGLDQDTTYSELSEGLALKKQKGRN